MDTRGLIVERLTVDFAPDALDVVDESHLHRGHQGAGGGGHYRVRIVSERFRGQAAVARQRGIYASLAGLMGEEIHALSMQTLTPEEAAART